MTAIYVLSGTTTGAPPGDYHSASNNWNVIGGGGQAANSGNATAVGGGAFAQIVNQRDVDWGPDVPAERAEAPDARLRNCLRWGGFIGCP